MDDYHEYQGKVYIPKYLLWKTVYYVYTVIQSNGDEVDEHVYSHTSDTNVRSMFIGQTKVQGNRYVHFFLTYFCGVNLKL